jgi:hypothetical protein
VLSLVEGKPIPTELRNEEAALRQEIDLEDEITAGAISEIVQFICLSVFPFGFVKGFVLGFRVPTPMCLCLKCLLCTGAED